MTEILRQIVFSCLAYLAMGMQTALIPSIGFPLAGQVSLLAVLSAYAVLNFDDRLAAYWTVVFAVISGLQHGLSLGVSLIVAGVVYGSCKVIVKPIVGKHPIALILSSGFVVSVLSIAVLICKSPTGVPGWEVFGKPVLATIVFATGTLILINGLQATLFPSRFLQNSRYVNS